LSAKPIALKVKLIYLPKSTLWRLDMKKVFLYFFLIPFLLTACNQATQPIKREYVSQEFAESLIDASIQGQDRQILIEEIMDKPKDFFPTNVLPENIHFSYIDENGNILTNHPDFQL
jgi:hypothetical protein